MSLTEFERVAAWVAGRCGAWRILVSVQLWGLGAAWAGMGAAGKAGNNWWCVGRSEVGACGQWGCSGVGQFWEWPDGCCFCGFERVLSVSSAWLWALCYPFFFPSVDFSMSCFILFILYGLVIGGCNSHLLDEVCVLWIVFQECLRRGLWKQCWWPFQLSSLCWQDMRCA